MHVYHYAAYEPSTLARLMGTHATREEEIDEFLRGEVFVDLLQVVRQGMRAGVESYSLKDVEKLFFTRRAEVSSGNEAVIEFERWLDDRDPARLDAIAAYNEEDCLATLELRDWLLARRPEAEREHGVAIPFLPPPEGRPKPERGRGARRDRAPPRGAPGTSASDGDGRELCARLLEYHRREARPGWWWYFRRLRMTDEELVDDGEALGCLEHDGDEPLDLSLANPRAKSLEWAFTFPPQQHQFDEGDGGEDPREDGTGWTVSAIDNATGEIRLRRSREHARRAAADLTRPRRADRARKRSRRRFGGSPPRSSPATAATRTSSGCSAASLPLGGASLQRRELADQRALLDRLEGSYLVVQGPPGSGKTYRGARLDHAPARAGEEGRDHRPEPQGDPQPARRDRARGRPRRDSTSRGSSAATTSRARTSRRARSIADVLDPEVTLVAGTAWLFAREELDGKLDTLVVDEAGQFSLADALACGTAAKRLVLLGDPLQLAQVTQGVHPDGSGASVLEHVLGDHETIPEDMGVFLEETRRMHPDVCRFVSEAFYEGRLRSIPECAERTTSDGVGVRWLDVAHEGNRVDSEEEAEAIAAEIERLMGHTFRDGSGRAPAAARAT